MKLTENLILLLFPENSRLILEELKETLSDFDLNEMERFLFLTPNLTKAINASSKQRLFQTIKEKNPTLEPFCNLLLKNFV